MLLLACGMVCGWVRTAFMLVVAVCQEEHERPHQRDGRNALADEAQHEPDVSQRVDAGLGNLRETETQGKPSNHCYSGTYGQPEGRHVEQ
jgi:hypothetical protein